ncbi:MAG: type IIA DNA topoisomerase subunit B [Planctomycetes bacterium]|nr:type IIA DNA topoisomerase subunit B [Planctomycetota bacterium]
MTTATKTKKYDESSIGMLEGLEAVRHRPSMYIGAPDKKGLHHLVWEIVDNSIDEFLNGHGDAITVTLHKSGDAVTVSDNGRGIPVGMHPKFKIPTLELILTKLHSGGKFGDGESYIRSGGLHGVGSSVVNALSRKLTATIKRDGYEWTQTFKRGKPTDKLEKVGPNRLHGTTIYFEPDPEIFRVTHFDAEWIKTRLDDIAYIHHGLKITYRNEIAGETIELTHPGGLPEFLQKMVTEGQNPAINSQPFYLLREGDEKIELTMQWTESTDEAIRSYVNGIRTSDGGTHEAGLRSATVKAIRNFMETHDVKAKGIEITANDIREGLVGILSVFIRDPAFQGQTKEKLNNPEMNAVVEGAVRPALEAWLNANMTMADQIVYRIMQAAKARQASREAAQEVKRKSATSRRLNLPGKLADCKSGARDDSELFIVEGKGAGGSAKQGRDNRTQAILPLRGKILNTEGLSVAKVMSHQELADVVTALGTGVGDSFNINNLRYGKIILLMDADADGHHITTLMLTFFFRCLPELVRKGNVFLAQPPLYKIEVGKEKFWARDDAHREEIIEQIQQKRPNAKFDIMRFKGLGEMDPQELAETTLDPKTRILLRVDIDSLIEADKTFTALLGKDPATRYQFIMESANQVDTEELDV